MAIDRATFATPAITNVNTPPNLPHDGPFRIAHGSLISENSSTMYSDTRQLRQFSFWSFLAALATLANAQNAPPASVPTTSANQSVVPPHLRPEPAVNVVSERKGVALIDALQRGGLVLYMRHTETGKVTADCTESNLSPTGEQQAVKIGEAMRALKIPFGTRESSELCRVQDTARLLGLGPFAANEDLNPGPKRPDHHFHTARTQRLATLPPPKTNALFIGHMQAGTSERERLFLEIGEVIVFRPDGKGAVDVIARIKPGDWAVLTGIR